MAKLSITRVTAALMVFSTVTYALLYFWHSLARSSFADDAFAVMFPGFGWSYIGFLTGLGWAIVYSVYIAIVYVPIYNLCCRVIPNRGAAGHTTKPVQDDHHDRSPRHR